MMTLCNNKRIIPLIGLIFIYVLLILYVYNNNLLYSNVTIFITTIISWKYILFFTVTVLLYNISKANFRGYLIFISTVLYIYLFKSDYVYPFRMVFDNICQLAYWKMFFYPELTGSVGSAYTKPGQLFLSGILYDLSNATTYAVFRIGMSAVMACCVLSQSIIAARIGGRAAGMLAIPVALKVFSSEYYVGSFSIYLVPTFLYGLYLYEYDPKHKYIGMLLLVLSIQFHILAIAPLLVLWLKILIDKNYIDLKIYTLYLLLSVLIWLGVILYVQGTLSRLNSGSAAGFVEYRVPSIVYFKQAAIDLSHDSNKLILVIFSIIGICTCIICKYYIYLYSLAFIVVIVLNTVILGGEFNTDRYFCLMYAFACSVGIGSAVLILNKYLKYLKSIYIASYGVIVLLFFTLLNFNTDGAFNVAADDELVENNVLDAKYILHNNMLPKSLRILTEDGVLASLVIMAPERLVTPTALQKFNILSEKERIKTLSHTDIIWIGQRDNPFYYINYLIDDKWKTDPFRMMIVDKLLNNIPGAMYGYYFEPVINDENSLVISVTPYV